MLKTQSQTCQKLVQILQKPQQQRQPQQLHFLSLTLKKAASSITHLTDWWMIAQCIQKLELHQSDTVQKSNVDWIYVLYGGFLYQGIWYCGGEAVGVVGSDWDSLELKEGSKYCVLTRQAKLKVQQQSEQRTSNQKKQFVKKILFQDTPISHKDLNSFYQQCQQHQIQKSQKFPIQQIDDMIFVIIKGSININYQWKRLIKLRQLGPGSIFSTFLGRYFYKTNEEVKNMRKYQFQIVGNGDCTVVGFSPDLFYQNQKFLAYRFVVEKAWRFYLNRVAEVDRIINGIGLLRLEKEEVVKNMKEQIQLKYLRQKGISVPVAIQRRKLRKITYSIFEQRSNRRKIPNIAVTQSARRIHTENDEKIGLTPSLTTIKRERNLSEPKDLKIDLKTLAERSKTEKIKRVNTLPTQNVEELRKKFSSRMRNQRVNTTQTQVTNRSKAIESQQQNRQTIYRFFRPEQFISKKLKNHYQSIRMKHQIKLPIDSSLQTLNSQKFKTSKSKKQYFEEYVNQRRIVKLGPKKRLLYKKKPGF